MITEKEFRRRMEAVMISLDPKEALALYMLGPGAQIGPPLNEHVPLAGVHKARMHHPKSTPAMKELSRVWLKQHGYSEGVNISPFG